MRILAVDDDPIILEMLQGALRAEDGYDLVCCGSAEEAQDLLAGESAAYDCFLLDIMLPGVDGIEFCAQLRASADYRVTPIIMITASKAPDLMERAFGAGATDFVMKPLDGMELGARINTAGMLNASLRRERAAQDSLAEMGVKMCLEVGDSAGLQVAGMSDMDSLAEEMAALPGGCYAMSFFAVDVPGLQTAYEEVCPRAFRSQLTQLAKAVQAGVAERPVRLAYAGEGRFVGVWMSRERSDLAAINADIELQLELSWDADAAAQYEAPRVAVQALSQQRLWSGRSAQDFLRKGVAAVPMAEVIAPVFAMAAE